MRPRRPGERRSRAGRRLLDRPRSHPGFRAGEGAPVRDRVGRSAQPLAGRDFARGAFDPHRFPQCAPPCDFTARGRSQANQLRHARAVARYFTRATVKKTRAPSPDDTRGASASLQVALAVGDLLVRRHLKAPLPANPIDMEVAVEQSAARRCLASQAGADLVDALVKARRRVSPARRRNSLRGEASDQAVGAPVGVPRLPGCRARRAGGGCGSDTGS